MRKHNSAFSLIELSIVVLIIGIVIAGVTQSSSLVRKMRLSSAQSLTKSSPAAGIRDLVLWVESTSEQSFDAADQEDGLTITNWYDLNPQSQLKNNFTSASASNEPTYRQNFLNGLPSVYFDGSNDYLKTTNTNTTSAYFSNADFTLFIVAHFPTFTNTTSVLFQLIQSGGSRNLGVEFNSTNLLRLDSANATAIGATSIIFNQPVVISGYRDSSNTRLYLNGAQYANATSGATTTLNGQFGIGAYIDSLDYFTKAYIGEIILYGHALTTEERKAVESYLGKKWGVKVS